MKEYCVFKNGNNIDVFYNENEAIMYAINNNCDKVVVPEYDENENEIAAEVIWENTWNRGHDNEK